MQWPSLAWKHLIRIIIVRTARLIIVMTKITTRNVPLMVSHSSAAVVLRSPFDRFMSEAHTGLIMEQHAHEPEEPSKLWIKHTELNSRILHETFAAR